MNERKIYSANNIWDKEAFLCSMGLSMQIWFLPYEEYAMRMGRRNGLFIANFLTIADKPTIYG